MDQPVLQGLRVHLVPQGLRAHLVVLAQLVSTGPQDLRVPQVLLAPMAPRVPQVLLAPKGLRVHLVMWV